MAIIFTFHTFFPLHTRQLTSGVDKMDEYRKDTATMMIFAIY